MSDDHPGCHGCGAVDAERLKCTKCGASVCRSCPGLDSGDLCIDCAPDPDDDFVTCDGCGEEGWAGRDNMFTFNCRVCGDEICENCSSNNLCEDCEAKTIGVVTVHFR